MTWLGYGLRYRGKVEGVRVQLRAPRGILEWLPLAALLALAVVGWRACDPPWAHSEYAPIRLLPMRLEPSPVVLGEPVTLVNGVCLETYDPVSAQVYLGLQQYSETQTIDLERINLIGVPLTTPQVGDPSVVVFDRPHDDEPGAERWHNGCFAERLTGIADPGKLHAGTWTVVLQVRALGAHGESQLLTERSGQITILSAP